MKPITSLLTIAQWALFKDIPIVGRKHKRNTLMKYVRYVSCILFLLSVLSPIKKSSAQDLPGSPVNLIELPSGSIVIAMDNVNQANSKNIFNLKSYGLIVHLLNNDVKIKWVIKAGKAKDGVDFSVNATKLKPTAGTATYHDFRSGPFVISADDVEGVTALIDGFNSTITTVNDKVKVYKTNAAVMVNQQYDLAGFKPKAALLNNGGNWDIHRDYMLDAGITFGMNSLKTSATNWSQAIASDLLVNCYTFASEAHWKEELISVAKPVTDHVRLFLQAGGNVLAECAAVRTYENAAKFLSTGGINPLTENKFTSPLSTLVYPNPDLSYSQFHGPIDIAKGGSLQNWTFSGSLQNNDHDHVMGSGSNQNIGASAAKFVSWGQGGMLYYLGNHKFDNVTDLVVLNGIRMYLNAFLTPPANNSLVCLKSTPAVIICRNSVINEGFENITGTNQFSDLSNGLNLAGSYQVIQSTSQLSNSGFLNVHPQTGDYFLAAYTSKKNTDRVWYATLMVKPNEIYNFCASVALLKGQSDDPNNLPGLYANGKLLASGKVTSDWSRLCGSYTVPAGVTSVEFSIRNSKKGSFYNAIDDICISLPVPMADRTALVDTKPLVNSVSLFPNPASKYFLLNVNALREGDADVRIVDGMGKLVATQKNRVVSGLNVIRFNDISNVRPGNYFVQIVTGGMLYNQKLIVVK